MRNQIMLGIGRVGDLSRLALTAFVCLGLLVSGAMAPRSASADATTLQALDVSSAPGNRVKLTFRLDGEPPQPESFTIGDPARIVVDLPGVRNAVTPRFRSVGLGLLESVSVSEAQGRTRTTLKLAGTAAYDLQRTGNSVLLTLDAGGGASTQSAGAQGPANTASPKDVQVDFRRGDMGQGVVVVTLPDNEVTADVREEGGRIVVNLRGARLPRQQERRLDVVDFATPVKTVDVFNRDGAARLVLETLGPREFLAYQANDRYTIEVKPVEPLIPAAGGASYAQRAFEGDALSLNFQDIEVRAVLQILADFTGLNVVVSDSVQGSLTLRLNNVPWDQAMDIILKTKGLSMRENGNVVMIAPTEEIAAREKLELEARRQSKELEPLSSELIQINYAKASEVGALLKSSDISMLSPRGNITIDERTNTLLMQDTSDKISEVRGLISSLDVPVRQVLIDSRVVIANDDFSKELGITWGGAGVVKSGGNTGGVAGTLGGAEDTATADTPLSEDTGAIDLAQRIGVNLATTNPAFGTLGVAILGTDYLLNMELSALQAEGRGEVLSNPRVVTTNRKQATIESGVEIPYQESTSSGATSVSFKKAVLSLIVTPQITPNDRIIMDLAVSKDSVGENVPTGSGGFVPSIDTRAVETQVLVNNGDTVVLGGIYERVKLSDVDKVPLLGDLPAIGRLFRRNFDKDDRAELLIFVTPSLIQDLAGLR